MSTAYAMAGTSSSAAPWQYGHETAGGSAAGVLLALLAGGPRLSLDTSDGSDVKSVHGVPMPVRALVAAEAAGAEEELSVNGDGGVV